MIKLKSILGEDFGGSYGGNRTRGKFYKGSMHNDEPFDFRDDKPARMNTPVSPKWDALIDRVNSDPRFKTETDGETYQITDTRGRNLVWQLYRSKSGLSWVGIGRASSEHPHPRQFNDVDALIKNFYEVTGLQPDSAVLESVIAEEYKVAGRPVTLIKHGTEDQTKWEVKFQNGSVKQYADVMSLIKPRPKLQEPRWQDSDGDGKWYEKGDDVKESAGDNLESEIIAMLKGGKSVDDCAEYYASKTGTSGEESYQICYDISQELSSETNKIDSVDAFLALLNKYNELPNRKHQITFNTKPIDAKTGKWYRLINYWDMTVDPQTGEFIRGDYDTPNDYDRYFDLNAFVSAFIDGFSKTAPELNDLRSGVNESYSLKENMRRFGTKNING